MLSTRYMWEQAGRVLEAHCEEIDKIRKADQVRKAPEHFEETRRKP